MEAHEEDAPGYGYQRLLEGQEEGGAEHHAGMPGATDEAADAAASDEGDAGDAALQQHVAARRAALDKQAARLVEALHAKFKILNAGAREGEYLTWDFRLQARVISRGRLEDRQMEVQADHARALSSKEDACSVSAEMNAALRTAHMGRQRWLAEEARKQQAAVPFQAPARGNVKGDKALVSEWLKAICRAFWATAAHGQRGGTLAPACYACP
jgi:hypothetical protein